MATTQAEIDAARVKALAYLIHSQKGAGHWSTAGGLEVQATAAALEALQNAGFRKGGPYSKAIAWLANAVPASVEGKAHQIMALQTAGLHVWPLL